MSNLAVVTDSTASIPETMLSELNTGALEGELNRDMLARLFLLKAGEALESMRGGYTSNPNGI